jgi:hypothetical protein
VVSDVSKDSDALFYKDKQFENSSILCMYVYMSIMYICKYYVARTHVSMYVCSYYYYHYYLIIVILLYVVASRVLKASNEI